MILINSLELYMIQDGSVDFKDTWTFLQRRFEDTKNINIAHNQLTDAFNGAMELSSIGFITVSLCIIIIIYIEMKAFFYIWVGSKYAGYELLEKITIS